jgi:hypothetical protein
MGSKIASWTVKTRNPGKTHAIDYRYIEEPEGLLSTRLLEALPWGRRLMYTVVHHGVHLILIGQTTISSQTTRDYMNV